MDKYDRNIRKEDLVCLLYEKDTQKIVIKKNLCRFQVARRLSAGEPLYRMLAEGTNNVIRPRIYVAHSSVNFWGMWRIYKS